MKNQAETTSEIQYKDDNTIESLEITHHHLKFVVKGLDQKTPLSKHLNPAIIQ